MIAECYGQLHPKTALLTFLTSRRSEKLYKRVACAQKLMDLSLILRDVSEEEGLSLVEQNLDFYDFYIQKMQYEK